MDKVGANFNNCLHQIEGKLKCKPLQIHLPLGTGKDFRGVIDLVNLSMKHWDLDHHPLGTTYSIKSLLTTLFEFCSTRVLIHCMLFQKTEQNQ